MDRGSLAIVLLSLLIVLVVASLPLLVAWQIRREEIERRVREEFREQQRREQERHVQQMQNTRPRVGFHDPRGHDRREP